MLPRASNLKPFDRVRKGENLNRVLNERGKREDQEAKMRLNFLEASGDSHLKPIQRNCHSIKWGRKSCYGDRLEHRSNSSSGPKVWRCPTSRFDTRINSPRRIPPVYFPANENMTPRLHFDNEDENEGGENFKVGNSSQLLSHYIPVFVPFHKLKQKNERGARGGRVRPGNSKMNEDSRAPKISRGHREREE